MFLVALALGNLLVAAASDWPSYRRDLNNSGMVSGPARAAALRLRVRWQYRADSRITSAPTTAGGLVFVGTWNGNVVALEQSSGKLRWKAHLGANNDWVYGGPRGVVGSIAIDRSVAYAISGNCVAATFDAFTGRERWRRTICDISHNDDTYASPVVSGGRVLYGINMLIDRPTDRGREVALDAATGTPLWTLYPQRYKGMGAGISTTPTVDPHSGVAYFGTGNPLPVNAPPAGPDEGSDSIIAFDVATGHVRWTFGPVHPHDTNDEDFLASPNRFAIVMAKKTHWIIGEGNKDGTYYAVAARTGREIWRHAILPENGSAMCIGTAAVGLGAIYVTVFADSTGAIAALRATDGTVLWRQLTGGEYEAPVLWGHIVFTTESKGWLDAFSAGSGKPLGRWKLSGVATGRGPTIANGALYVAAGNALIAFALP